jgi:dihydrofolate synthase/folylpolyglutamate synthase
MTYTDALAWLYSSRTGGIKLGLETTHRLLDVLGSPHRDLKFLHVAGTNGKGSVCAMLDSICRAAGLRTGLYTSPHLVTFAERIRVDGVPIPRDAIISGVERLRQLTANWTPLPTFFELTTALALEYFAHSRVDIVVLETGLGGRLDSTNAVIPLASVITPIALDHQQYLGETIAEIASEKAGILKPNIPAVSSTQHPDAAAVLRETAAERRTPLEFVEAPLEGWTINLAGSHQRKHAALAVAAVRAAGLDVTENALRAGLATVQWPGRFQKLPGGIVLDGAHNPAAAELLARTWSEEFGSTKAHLILGILADKDLDGIIKALLPIAATVTVCPVKSERTINPEELLERIHRHQPNVPVRRSDSLPHALQQTHETPVLIAGSLFLAGEALAIQEQLIPDPAV